MKQLHVYIPHDMVDEIDAERRKQDDMPSRCEMIRRLLAKGLDDE